MIAQDHANGESEGRRDTGPKRHRTAALRDAGATSAAQRAGRELLECGSPLPLSDAPLAHARSYPRPLAGARSYPQPLAHARSYRRPLAGARSYGDVRAFTLLEVMMAVALVGLVLIGLNTFIFSMGELWGRNSDLRLFDQHVRGVTRYLQRELRTASLPPAVPLGNAAIEAREVKVEFGRNADLLTFGLREGSRLMAWPERPLPEVVCSLEVRSGTGLVMYWGSVLEERYERDPPRELVLSPHGVALSYEYYDADFKRWESLPALRKDRSGNLETPGRLRLTFRYRDLTRESLVALPTFGEGMPPF